MDVRVELWRKLSAKELVFLNCGVGEDSWESLGQQGDQTSQSWRKSSPEYSLEGWCWNWSSTTLATWCEELTHWKRSWCWKNWRQEEKVMMTEDEMIGWHHWLCGREFEQALGVGDGQGGVVCCSPWNRKELDMTEQLNWIKLNFVRLSVLASTSAENRNPLQDQVEAFLLAILSYVKWC